MKKFLVILLTGSLIFANSAFAARFGGGKSRGMQRSTANSQSNYSPPPQQQPGAAPNNNQRPGMGAGTAALLGAAAGAAGGYMLGKSSNNSNASGAMRSEAQSQIPWGTILILIVILGLGLMFFRRKTTPKLSTNGNSFNNYGQNFNIPNINRTNSNTQTANNQSAGTGTSNLQQPFKMPDGVETVYFLRQVKGMFLHIQSMNNPDNINEIKKYMTDELFTQTQDEVANNSVVADFTNLDCILLQCENSPSAISNDGVATEPHLVASVKFFGQVSEDPSQPAQAFSEIWNFIKSASTNNKWLVAGIQQDPLNS